MTAVVVCTVVVPTSRSSGQGRGKRATEAGTAADSKPKLWVLSVGVSSYADKSLRLNYADDDAKAVKDELWKQKARGFYRDVEVFPLVDAQAQRETIIEALDAIASKANGIDVVVVFLAGHGLEAYGRYYFLPHPATPATVTTKGLGMSELNDALSRLHKNANSIIVMLDTCEAGALEVTGGRTRAGRPPDFNPAKEIGEGEGVFVFGASKGGELASEITTWQHGVFTKALLEALRGEQHADANNDGWLAVDEAYQHIDKRVRELTKNRQHPFRRMTGTGPIFAATRDKTHVEIRPVPPATLQPLNVRMFAVLPFVNLSSKEEDQQAHRMRGLAIKSDFETKLGRIDGIEVCIPDHDIDVAGLKAQGIGRVIKGEFFVSGRRIRINASVIDAATNKRVGGGSVEGDNDDDVLALHGEVIQKTVESLGMTESQRAAIEKTPTNNSVSNLELLLQAEGEGTAPLPTQLPEAPPARKTPDQQSLIWPRSLLAGVAQAADPETEIKRLLEAYQNAYSKKELEILATLFVSFPAHQREALRKYLDNADDLKVEITNIEIAVLDGDKAAVTYTRRDRFTERHTGKEINLEVRLKKTVVLQEGQWKIGGGA